MKINTARFAAVVLVAALAAGCNDKQQTQTAAPAAAAPAAAPASGPDATVMASVHALRTNNVGALLENSLPPAELTKLKADWSKELNKDPVTDKEREDFAEQMKMLTAPGAEDKLFAEVEPQLKQFEHQSAQQLPMMIAMGQGFIQSAIQQNKELSPQQKQESSDLIDAMAKWAQTAKFTDTALAKQAIAVVCATARQLDIKTIDQLRALSYDQGMQKAGVALAGMKKVLEVYGLSMDKALDSVKVQAVSNKGDAAKVKVTYTAFEKPFSTETDLVKVDGRWFTKQAIEQWKKEQAHDASKVAEAAPADEAKTAK